MDVAMKFSLLSVLITYFIHSSGTNFTFEDLKKTKNGCAKDRDCNRGRFPQDCNCQNSCIEYGDCCLSSNFFNFQKMVDATPHYECIRTDAGGNHYYMKSQCPDSETDKELRSLCLQANTDYKYRKIRQNPFVDTPVTSNVTSITYKNYYCAVCNNESIANLLKWKVKLEWKGTLTAHNESYVNKNLRFYNGSWGFDMAETEFYTIDIAFEMPRQTNLPTRNCMQFIDKCSPAWKDQHVANLCRSYVTVVYHKSEVYRNYHCVICNFADASNLSCSLNVRHFKNFSPFVFSVLFHNGVSEVKCPMGSIWDQFSKHCQPVVCFKENYQYQNGRCVESKTITGVQRSVSNNSDINITETYTNIKENTKITLCDKILIPKANFIMHANLTIVANFSQQHYNQDEYELHKDGILVCLPTHYSSVLSWISFFGLSLSSLCLFLHLLIFILVPDLRNLSDLNLTSLCLSLLVAYTCFISTTFISSNSEHCRALAAIMYYFFLASFMWMNVMSFDIWFVLHMSISKLRVTSGKKAKRFIYYSIYAWTVPLIATTTVLIIDHIKPLLLTPTLIPELGELYCWFGQRYALLLYFAAPLAIIMSINIFFFVLTVKAIVTVDTKSDLGKVEPYHFQIKLYLKLGILMGLGWIIGIVAGFLHYEFVWYLFVIVNAFQGLYILLAYTCSVRVRRALKFGSSKLILRLSSLASPTENTTSSHLTDTASTKFNNDAEEVSTNPN